MRWFLYLLVGLMSGILSGLFGIGGGILLIPALVYWFGYTQHEAQGTTLAVLIPPIGLFAAIEYYRRGQVRLGAVPLLILGLTLGAYLGAILAPRIPEIWMRRLFGLLLCYVGVDFLLAGISNTPFWPAVVAFGLFGTVLSLGRRRARATCPASGPSESGVPPPESNPDA
ncbi:MAG: sulfite exporter TauE/SafE family protein [Gemmatales bacterium]|nr:sulfite exporter TauE/SafE family protein [Gemmatales bacterium]MDW7993255.1 sulfite exporter TauE/SafE family protein [Gemmatales bacterium]